MNEMAERHLVKARGYLEKGDAYYVRAAVEIRAAMEADPSLTQKQVGEWFGHRQSWVSELLKWADGGYRSSDTTPFGGRGEGVKRSQAASFLRDAPLEQVEQVIERLPSERRGQVAAAAGHSYLEERFAHDEKEARLTPGEKDERDRNSAVIGKAVMSMVAPLSFFAIAGRIDEARENLHELVEAGATGSGLDKVGEAIEGLVAEYEMARALRGES
jgi:hypothetical protein